MALIFTVAEGHDPETVRAALHEQLLDVTIPVLLVALVDGKPRQCTLLELIDHYLGHQRAVRGGGPGADEAIAAELARLAELHGDDRRTLITG